jgi:tape measure domain-containing protein
VAENLQFNLEVDNSKAIQSIDEFFNKFQSGAKVARAVLDNELGTKGKIEVVVDVKNKKAANEVKKISDEAKKVKENMALANAELGKTASQVKKQITALKTLRDNTEKFDQATGKLNAKWKQFNDKLQIAKNQYGRLNFEGPINTLKNALTGVIGKFTLVQTLANLFTAAIQAVGRAIGDMVQNAIQFEVLSLQLEAFTGSAKNAQIAFQAFGATAAATPFDLKQVAQAGKTMMAFGMSTKESMEMTDRLAIAAAATGGELNNLSRNLGQIQAQGRAYTRDLTQFAMQGIPIWEELSEVTGESVIALKDMAKEGQIGFEEVSQAIRNMTDEGSAFAEIAERMGDTVQGRLARIQQASDKMALSFAKAFNVIDKQLPVVSGLLKSLESVLNFFAKHMENILLLLGSIALAIAGAFGLKALLMLKTFIAQQGALLLMLKAVNIALGVMKVLLGGFGIAMIAIAAVVGIFGALKGAVNDAKKAAQEKAEADFVAMDATKRLTDAELKKVAAHNTAIGVAANYVLAMREIAQASAEATETEITKLEEIMARRTAAHEQAMEELDEEIEAKEQQIQDEKDSFEELMDLKKQAHEDRLDDIDEEYEAKKKLIDDEIASLRKKGPFEQALYDLRKKELQDKINSNKLEGKALLQAQARLERMLRTEKIQKLRLKDKELEFEKAQKVTAEEERYGDEVKEATDKHEQRLSVLETELQGLKDRKSIAEEAHQRERQEVQETIDSYRNQKTAIDDSTTALHNQIKVVQRLATETKILEDRARRAAAELDNLAKKESSTQHKGGERSRPKTERAAGGPVTGGTSYTVNELGKEAFLSAQGRLSMIDAPSWGSWTAPGKGTVIPAHLASQLNIPTGGINLNKAASGNAMMASENQGTGSIVKAIKSAMMGGDNITNNVTVQSDNTTKTASDMLVSMTRLRRRRYS